MKRKFTKIFIVNLFMLIINQSYSQTVNINVGGGAGTSGNVVVGPSTYHASESIFLESEIGASNFITAGTAINQIAFSLNGTNTTATLPIAISNYSIYMQNVPAATTTLATGTYSLAAYTLVFNGTLNLTVAGWNKVTLTTTFTRTAGSNLQVLLIRNNGAGITGTNFDCALGNATAGSAALTTRRYNSTAAPVENSTSLTASNFRFAIQLAHIYPNDLGVDRIETFGKIPTGAAFPHSINAVVTNYGSNTMPAGTNVSLSVTGSNTFSNVKTTSSLAPGASQTLTFDPITSMVVGTNNITVSVTGDDNTSNNSTSFTQLVTTTAVSYSNNATVSSNVGFGTSSGILAIAYKLPVSTTVSGVKVQLMTGGNTVFGVITNSVGEILAQSADYAVQPTDSNTVFTFTFPTPVNVPKDSVRFVGLGQKTGAYGYYPVGFQADASPIPNTYATLNSISGGNPISYYTTLGRWMIESVLSASAPISLSNFSGKKDGSQNLLEWTTSTETNNAGFELQRSINGKDFSTISNVNSKAVNGNSNSNLSYSYADVTPLKGTNYYRLYQKDKDGKGSYSSIVTIKGMVKGIEISNVYPNPVQDKLTITLSATNSEKLVVGIYDLVGKEVAKQVVQANNGSINVQFNTNNFAAGSYLIKVVTENGVIETQKFVKQ